MRLNCSFVVEASASRPSEDRRRAQRRSAPSEVCVAGCLIRRSRRVPYIAVDEVYDEILDGAGRSLLR
jgi:hypothetical protein